jgi:hypothetical protein
VAPALGIYAITDNILVYPTALAVFVYFGLIRQSTDLSSPIPTAEYGAQEHRTSVTTRPEMQSVSLRQ